MRVIESADEIRAVRRSCAEPVALVPTMGALHAGHLALLETARSHSRTSFASLFVNPTQFGPGEDFDAYPRDPDRDLATFEAYDIDYVFMPSVEEMYPPGGTTTVDPGAIGTVLEGRARPGHFKGVATVVTKLLILIRPDVAVFGEKDAQQVVVIRRLVKDLLLGMEVLDVPTVRDPDGLALSSRNAYLTRDQRRDGAILYRALLAARRRWEAGERDAEALREIVRREVAARPSASLEYVSVADPETLEEVSQAQAGALISLAARVGSARLIDNIRLSP